MLVDRYQRGSRREKTQAVKTRQRRLQWRIVRGRLVHILQALDLLAHMDDQISQTQIPPFSLSTSYFLLCLALAMSVSCSL